MSLPLPPSGDQPPPPPSPYSQQAPPPPYGQQAPPPFAPQPSYGPQQYAPQQQYPSYPNYPVYQPKASRMVRKPLTVVAMICGAVVILGSFLPWITISDDLGGGSIGGMDRDGKVTVFFGIVAIVFLIGCLNFGKGWPMGACIGVFGITVLVALADIGDISSKAKDVGFGSDAFKPGIGIWLVLVAGIAGVVVSIIALVSREQPVT